MYAYVFIAQGNLYEFQGDNLTTHLIILVRIKMLTVFITQNNPKILCLRSRILLGIFMQAEGGS